MAAPSSRPRLAIRVAITGHRWRDPDQEAGERLDPGRAEAVQASLRAILHRIRETTTQVGASFPDCFRPDPPQCTLLSAMAAGADELAAAVAVEPAVGFDLAIIAPYDLTTDTARFADGTPARTLWNAARARLILDGVPYRDTPASGEARAWQEATLVETNRRLVWNCDLVIAVWDGHPSRGEAGTANVIARARAEGLPVIHIDANTPSVVALLDAAGAPVGAADPFDAIAQVVTRLLAPPHAAEATTHAGHGDAGGDSVQRGLHDFAAEAPAGWLVRRLGARVYGAAQRLLAGSQAAAGDRGIAADPAAVTVPWQTVPSASRMSERRAQVIDPAYRRADYFASAYGARHRSTFTTILFFAPFAVVCAWVGSLVDVERKLPFAVAELSLLLILTTFFVRSRRLRFHEKWLDYRLLAERLRHLGFLWPLGRTSPVIRVPTHAVMTDPRPAWVNWWYRAVAREAGLASLTLDRDTVRALATQVDQDLIAAQLRYNQATHHIAHHAEHRLHLMPWIPLLMAVGAAAAHVLEHLHLLHLDHTVVTILTGIGILGPAFGAALHGFASQAGFQEVGIRTDASAQQLTRFAERLARVDFTQPLASKAVGDIALSVAEVMGEDLAGWRVDYLARPVTPPG